MLDKHLIATFTPLAEKENIIEWKNYRVTVLADRLFRIENNANKRFRDSATQTVWFRNAPKQTYEVTELIDGLQIKTQRVTLFLRENLEDCRVIIDGKELPLENNGNLKGTYRTLDCCNGSYLCAMPWAAGESGELKLGDGVCSMTGVAVYNDANALSLSETGEVLPTRGEGADLYVFAYGDDYRAAVKALYGICGETPLIPRFALGNWWSRYHDYTDKEYLTLLQKFEDNDIPLTVATVDMDWHYSIHIDEELGISKSGKGGEYYVGKGSYNWTGYTWNKNLFPDYKEFLKKVKEKNLKVTLNLHPADGVRWWEKCYGEMADALGMDKTTEQHIPFNIADTTFINAYFSVLHKPYESDGVDFWWIDWQQGTDSSLSGLDPLWSLNHYHYLDNAKNHFSPLILSRYAGVGSHRYPLGFSGDTFITWDTLAYLPYFTATASNVGYTWWSHDIGGHMLGEVDGELYTRHVQFGVFSPINRLHSSDAKVTTKEPWYYGNGRGEVIAKWLRFRHKLLPYLYTCSRRTQKDGLALVEPIYYQWKEKDAYACKNEYLFGGDFIVAPVAAPMQDGFAEVETWLPKGEWTDIFTGDTYRLEKAEKRTLLRTLDSIPVLAKAGTILPLSADKGNSCKNPKNLEIWVYNGSGEFSLYEDGRENENTDEFITKFSTTLEETEGACTQTLRISSKGMAGVIPSNRTILVCFKNIKDGALSLRVNGKEEKIKQRYTDYLSIELSFAQDTEYEIQAKFKKQSELDELKARTKEVLLGAEMNNDRKCKIFDELSACETKNDYLTKVVTLDLPNCIKKRLKETC